MKAACYQTTGAAKDVLTVEDVPDPEPSPGEVLVRVAVSAVHPSDVKTRAGARGPMTFPRVIPQSDGAGRIIGVPPGTEWQVGVFRLPDDVIGSQPRRGECCV